MRREDEAFMAAMASTAHTRPPNGEAPAPGLKDAGDVPPDAAGKTVAAVLGEIVWLMSESAEHKHHTVGDLEWLVMPPILLRQFRLFYKDGRPVAVVLYARASAEVEARLNAGTTLLQPAQWKSGDRTVIVRTIAPWGGAEEFASQVSHAP